MKILLIDDYPDNLICLTAILRDSLGDCQIETANSGMAGIRLVHSFQPDVILLDVQMPGIDGFETCKILKRDPATQRIPVIFLTAEKVDSVSRIKGLEIGGEVFLTKPIEPGELMAQVRAMLRLKQTRDAQLLKGESLERLVGERTESLQESEERFVKAFESAPIGMALISTKGRWLKVNQVICDILGYSETELRGQAFQDVLYSFEEEKDKGYGLAQLNDLLAGTISVYKTQRRHLHKSGQVIWTVLHVSLIRNQQQDPLYFVCQLEDITDFKQQEANNGARLHLIQFSLLHSLDELLEETLNEVERQTDSSIGFFHFVDDDQNSLTLQTWSTRTKEKFCRAEGKGLHYAIAQAEVWVDCILQRQPVIHNDYASRPHRKGMPPGYAEVIRELAVPVIRGDKIMAVLAVGNKRSDYTRRDTETVSLLADYAWDIVERKRTEEKLYESEQQFRTLANSGQALIWTSGMDKRCDYFNQPWLTFTGRSLEQEMGDGWVEGVHPDDLTRCFETYVAAFDRRQRFSMDYRLRHHDGTYRWIQDDGSPRYNVHGEFIGYIGHCLDITARKQAEDGWRDSQKRFAQIAESFSEMIWEVDASGLFLYCSDAVEKVLGYLPGDLVGKKHFYDLFAPEMRENLKAAALKAFETRQPFYRFENPCMHKDGQVVILETSGLPILDADGRLLGYRGIDTDITERKRMDEALRFTQFTIDHMADAAFWVTADKRIVYANAAASQLLGYAKEELLGMSVSDIAITENTRNWPEHWRMLKQKGSLLFESRHIAKNGETIPVEVQANHMTFGNHEYNCAFVRNISDRKQTETNLQNYRDHLEELVDLRTLELSAARDQAMMANRAKSAFLANMSHELRTPLTAVIGFAQMMAQNSSASVLEKKNLDIILRSGEHLLALINDILDFSKIEAGRIDLDLRDVDLGELFRDITDMMRDRVEKKGLRLVVNRNPDFPHFANTDAGKLRQIIINLVANAIKFTTDGQITIDLDARLVEDGYLLTIDIEDTGIGISKDKLDLIFQPFVQAKSQRMAEGTGLGLAISRQYVEILGGVITVDSELNRGSRFHLAIPAGRTNADSIQALAEHPRRIGIESPTSDIRILVVEDQQENLQLINSLLSHFGFQIREAVNGQEAISAFQEWQPHLILMDRRMPVLDGIAATRQIRALPGGGTPVIIAVSAQTFKNEQQEMLAAGSNGFLCKPFSIDEMLKMLGDKLKLKLRYAKPPAKVRSLTPEDLRPVPVPVLKNLHALIIEGQHDDLLAWVNGQAVLDDEAKQAMKNHLDNYQFEVLAKLMGPLIMAAAMAGKTE